MHPLRLLAAMLLTAAMATVGHAARPDGALEIRVVDALTQQPVAARIRLRDARGRPRKSSTFGVVQFGDHFYIDGAATLGLRRGQYTFDLDAGWQRPPQSGHFTIDRRSEDSKTVEVKSAADLAKEGWYAADIDATRPLRDLAVVLRAEQLAYASVTAWTTAGRRWQRASSLKSDMAATPTVQPSIARWETDAGALLFVAGGEAFDKAALPDPDASVAKLVAAREAGLRIIASDITSWRLPIWLAGDVLDAVAVIDRTNQFGKVDRKASRGQPPPRKLFPGTDGLGQWREAIYFHILNAGLQMPAVAGSGSGDNESPLGTNRVYAHCPDGFAAEAWWQSVVAGQTVVTAGPLLRPLVEGQPPGYVFRTDTQGRYEAVIGLNLSTRQKIDYLDLIKDGDVVESVALRDWANAGGQLPTLSFDASGWFAVRAVTNTPGRYQFALTSPYYVEGAGGPRISRQSCQFFLDWLDAYEARFEPKASEAEAVATARDFWRQRLSNANAE